jgi:hypothetical protein
MASLNMHMSFVIKHEYAVYEGGRENLFISWGKSCIWSETMIMMMMMHERMGEETQIEASGLL